VTDELDGVQSIPLLEPFRRDGFFDPDATEVVVRSALGPVLVEQSRESRVKRSMTTLNRD
jgi:hypothetical protein